MATQTTKDTTGPDELAWKLEHVGRWSEPVRLEVTRERIASYAAATGDEHALHRSGGLAPPVFPVVGALIEAIMPAFMGVVPPQIAMRVVHGEQDFRYHRPIRPGTTLVSRGAAVGVHGVSTGVIVLGKGITETDAGDLVVEQYTAAFFRGVRLDVHVGETLPEHAFDDSVRANEPDVVTTHRYDPDQTQRYSQASGDPMPIHLDDAVARSVGLPGIIVHGLCTLAFCSRVIVGRYCDENPTRLRRLACRFSDVVLPSEQVTTRAWSRPDGTGVAFETTTDTGKTAIKDGLAELGPPAAD